MSVSACFCAPPPPRSSHFVVGFASGASVGDGAAADDADAGVDDDAAIRAERGRGCRVGDLVVASDESARAASESCFVVVLGNVLPAKDRLFARGTRCASLPLKLASRLARSLLPAFDLAFFLAFRFSARFRRALACARRLLRPATAAFSSTYSSHTRSHAIGAPLPPVRPLL